MRDLLVEPNTRITMHFSIQMEEGDLIDSTRDKAPATFVFGDGSLLPNFEKLLLGLKEGERRSFVLTPDKAFGKHNQENVHAIPRTQFAESIDLEEGLLIGFQDASGEELPGLVKTINEQFVLIDFNHPLAGKTIIFDAEIIKLEALNAEMLVNWIEQRLNVAKS